MITITCKVREKQKKGDVRRLRREGYIPCVVYSKGKPGETLAVVKSEIEAAMRSIRGGFLPTTVFSIKKEDGSVKKVLPREVQYVSTTYEISHMDFMELHDDVPVQVKVPVELTNTVDCVGVKLGGYLQPVMRHIMVRSDSRTIPSHFEADVKDLDIFQSKKVKDLAIPANVTCLEKAESVVVMVSKK